MMKIYDYIKKFLKNVFILGGPRGVSGFKVLYYLSRKTYLAEELNLQNFNHG